MKLFLSSPKQTSILTFSAPKPLFSKVEAVKTTLEKRARKVTYAIIKPGEPELHITETNTVWRIIPKGEDH